MRGPLALLAPAVLAIVSPAFATPQLRWSNLYDGGGAYLDVANAVLAAPDGDAIVGGESADGVGGTDQLIRRLERATGNPLWETRFPAYDGNDMALSALAWTPDGNVLVGGYIRGCVG